MKFFISIVSHGHAALLIQNDLFSSIANLDFVEVVVKDNLGEPELKDFCLGLGFHYIEHSPGLGFGANNNVNFDYVKEQLNARKNDCFLMINPDVKIDSHNLDLLKDYVDKHKCDLVTIDLFKDEKYTIRDMFIRTFPRFVDFLSSFVMGVNKTIVDRAQEEIDFDWCAGSFMCFRVEVYEELGGFDEAYFMYCEDIDICFRLKQAGYRARYYPSVRAVHFAQHSNRGFLSKHFYWHIKSLLRFLVIKNGINLFKLFLRSKTSRLGIKK